MKLMSSIPWKRLQQLDEIDPVTPRSIAEAKAHRDAERREIERKTGVRINDDGSVTQRKPHVVCCGLCSYTAFALVYDVACDAVANHIALAHWPRTGAAA